MINDSLLVVKQEHRTTVPGVY